MGMTVDDEESRQEKQKRVLNARKLIAIRDLLNWMDIEHNINFNLADQTFMEKCFYYMNFGIQYSSYELIEKN